MNRRRADLAAGLLVAAVLLAGGALAWQAFRQRRALDRTMGSMMDGPMGAVHGPDPLWYVFGTLLLSAVVAGLYLAVRGDLSDAGASDRSRAGADDATGPSGPSGPSVPDGPDATGTAGDGTPTNGTATPEARPRGRVLDLLPEDERRVLEPVLDSPGITQVELRDRSAFSKSKVSQTVSALEKRGLLYRERQGRTYRVYPSDDLREDAG